LVVNHLEAIVKDRRFGLLEQFTGILVHDHWSALHKQGADIAEALVLSFQDTPCGGS
jgi:hypothetical protein